VRVFKALLKFLAGTLAVLIAAEIVLRLQGYGGLERYAPDRELLWKLKPEQRTYTKVGHYPVQINSMGMRSPEFSCERDTNTFRVAVFGDSYTFGWGVRQEETYAAQLQDLLQQTLPHRKVEVWNAGCNGYSVLQEVAYLRRLVSCRPDLVILTNTFNDDALFDAASLDEQARTRIMRGVQLKNLARRFALYNFTIEMRGRAVYLKIRRKIVSGTWGTAAPLEEVLARMEAQLRESQRICRDNHIALIFLITTGGGSTGPYQQRMLDVAAKDGVPVVSMIEPLLGAPRDKYWIPDGHPNPAGHRAIAEALVEYILARSWPSGDTRSMSIPWTYARTKLVGVDHHKYWLVGGPRTALTQEVMAQALLEQIARKSWPVS
jgi:lysophospholipase L1-like esterase